MISSSSVAFVYLGLHRHSGWPVPQKTKLGLNVQAIGHNPAAADAAGINVTRWKYVMILLGGGICGIGGACCAMIIAAVSGSQ
ncbi:MAG: ABC transporter permease subunit [Butyricicoccus pullicaecorum]